MTQEELC